MPTPSVGRVIAACVGIVCLVLLLLSFVAVGAAIPAWVVFVLIGALALAFVIG